MTTQVFSSSTARQPMSRLWDCLVLYWQLPPSEAKHWWRALWRSLAPGCRAWRQAVLLFEARDAPSPESVFAFLESTCSPSQVATVLEALVEERQLPRRTASQIEERLLQRVDRHGRWY